jgi:hypothetical protein
MSRIYEEIQLNCNKEAVFKEITSVDFMKSIDSNYGLNTTILFENERLLRSVSKVERIGSIEIERINIPETFTIITQRRQPLPPFIYQISIQILCDKKDATLLKWINEFELDIENKSKEELILSFIKKNDLNNLEKTKQHFEKMQNIQPKE